MTRTSSAPEKPLCQPPRKLTDWLNPDGQRKVHSMIDKVYQPTNLRMAWEKVKANRGSGGIDGQSIEAVEQNCDEHLQRLHEDLRTDRYQPLPVRRVDIPKTGKPGEWRPLGIPAVIDRVCQQALLNRLEPIFEPLFDDSSFGYRPGRSAKDALRKVWREIDAGAEWIVDADLKDYFGSIDHDKLMTLVAQRVADGRVLTLIERMLTAGAMQHGRLFPTTQGTPQGGVVSPLLSNILLTPFDREMRRRGYQLTRYADDWAVTCRSRQEAAAALRCAEKILATLGVQLNLRKTRIVHVRRGFAFLGYTNTMMHARSLGVDGIWSIVGSANFDNRSLELNDELNVHIVGREFAARLHDAFENDLRVSRPIALDTWRRRPLVDEARAHCWGDFAQVF
jgi:RNA-directed DNA polymerase